jgi:aromatic-L-amino-acid decarboxylase
MVIRAFGHEGLAARIREHVRLAQVFRGWVEQDPAFEVVAPSPLSVVCFRWRGDGLSAADADRANEKILDSVNLSGEAYLSHTKLGGRTVLRLAIGNIRTEERHVRKAWEAIRNAVGQVNR